MTQEEVGGGPGNRAARSRPDGLRVEALAVERDGFRGPRVSFRAARGEVLWVTGRNGAGKSTLLHLIAGLIVPAEGEIRFDGRLLSSRRGCVQSWRRGTAILLQDLGLWPHLSVRAQCRLVARTTGGDPNEVETLGEALAVAALLDRRTRALSGGEAQRCAMLRTLVQPVDLLLLDEPFGEQHEDGIARMERIIADRARSGATILIAGQRAPAGASSLAL